MTLFFFESGHDGMLNNKLSNETEWVEFKYQNDKPEKIGEYLSALANSASLTGKVAAFMILGYR